MRVLTLPVLEHGEIYIRFGEPTRGVGAFVRGDTVVVGGASGATPTTLRTDAAGIVEPIDGPTLRRLIREELEALEPGAAGVAPSDAVRVEELRAMEERILDRLRAVEESGAAPIVVRTERSDDVDIASASTARRVHEVRPHGGLSIDPSAQVVAGVAADIGPLKPDSPIRIVPAVAVGLGEGSPTTLLTLGLEYRAPLVIDERRFAIQPYVGGGPSLFKQESFEAAFSLQAGLLGRVGPTGPDVFVAFQGVDFFQNGRVLLGLRRLR